MSEVRELVSITEIKSELVENKTEWAQQANSVQEAVESARVSRAEDVN